MNLNASIKEIMRRSWTTYKKVKEECGFKSDASISAPMKKNDMHVSTLLNIANACGYDVVLIKREEVKTEFPIKIDCAGKVNLNKPSECACADGEEAV